jgi:phage terminase large subunit GpA-like protein
MKLSGWIERNVILPEGLCAVPGPMKLWPYQKQIADCIGDPSIERVTLVKAARIGFSSLLTAAIGYWCAKDPAPILVLLPTESDCKDYVVSDIEPLFEASPALHGVLVDGSRVGQRGRPTAGMMPFRSTMLSRRFKGGSLKIVASKAPRNLRRHTARILLIDEADAMENSTEGDVVALAEKRPLTFANRKIILGSTPIDIETSHVIRAYEASDTRIFEVPCPKCGVFTEILWQHIEWPPEKPQDARFRCPACKCAGGREIQASDATARRLEAIAARNGIPCRVPAKQLNITVAKRVLGQARGGVPCSEE